MTCYDHIIIILLTFQNRQMQNEHKVQEIVKSLALVTSNILQIITKAQILKQAPKHIAQKLTGEIQFINQKLGIDIPQEPNYKKPADFTYLQYFNNLLAQEPGIIINSQADPFTIKEDLYILVYASKNPIIKKALQPMAKNTEAEVYKKNSTKLVKRKVEKLLQRYYELEPINEQRNIKKIVKWLQEHGLTEAYITMNKRNIKIQKQKPIMQVRKSQRTRNTPSFHKEQIKESKPKKQIKKNQEEQNPVNEEISNSQSFIKEVKDDETVKTPQKKITPVNQNAPKKSRSNFKKRKSSPFTLNQQERKQIIQLKSEDFQKPQTAGNANQVKQESIRKLSKEQKKSQQKKQQQIKTTKKKRIVHKINREHMNYPPSKQVAIKVSSQNVELNKILGDIQEKTKIKQLHILKYLDQLSGDLSLLNKFLVGNDKTMLWSKKQDKLLEDKIFMDKADQNGSVYTKKEVESLTLRYINLVRVKGKQAINRRIAYLSLS